MAVTSKVSISEQFCFRASEATSRNACGPRKGARRQRERRARNDSIQCSRNCIARTEHCCLRRCFLQLFLLLPANGAQHIDTCAACALLPRATVSKAALRTAKTRARSRRASASAPDFCKSASGICRTPSLHPRPAGDAMLASETRNHTTLSVCLSDAPFRLSLVGATDTFFVSN